MNILVLGGTRFFGIELVKVLLKQGHHVTIATRGKTSDPFQETVDRIVVDRNSQSSMKKTFEGKSYDVVYDHLAYCSISVKIALEAIQCEKYILVSSTAVYNLHQNTKEEDFDPYHYLMKWGQRDDFDYDEGKRQAEAVLVQEYPKQDFCIVRFPIVLGKEDYTKRLYFYVKHIQTEKPMLIDNLNAQLSFVLASEAGQFLAYLAQSCHRQIFNASATGTLSLAEIISYIEKQTNKQLVSDKKGCTAPYNSIPSHSICNDKAVAQGFDFKPLKSWLFELVDYYLSMPDEV